MNHFSLVLIGLACVTSGCYGYGSGAPACVDQPKHGGSSPQAVGSSPYQTSLVQVGGGMWKLTIGQPGGDVYKGLLLKTASDGVLVPNAPNLFKKVTGCNGYTNAWTHTAAFSRSGDTVSTWTFMPNDNSVPTFTFHILKDYNTFWTNVQV